MSNLYYRDEQQPEQGPISRTQLQEMLWTKQISDLGELRHEGGQEWLPILSVLCQRVPPPLPYAPKKPIYRKILAFVAQEVNKSPGHAIVLLFTVPMMIAAISALSKAPTTTLQFLPVSLIDDKQINEGGAETHKHPPLNQHEGCARATGSAQKATSTRR